MILRMLWRDGAVIDGRYRYLLERGNGERPVCFVMLNPSTADATENDPTIRKCLGFARRWGRSHLVVVNLFALRATDPRTLWADGVEDPVGPLNKDYVQFAADSVCRNGGFVVAAWGARGGYMQQDETVRAWLSEWPTQCLGLTENFKPRHPLRLPYKTRLGAWGDYPWRDQTTRSRVRAK